ncbi:MAG TPA: DUF480 domain-containing protein [Acidimicrobiales bacterium]|jgi:hypothetical protein|nr:DUF480 domain-containing protein [Acidimicrobiales bacterium]
MQLSPECARVLGALVEKGLATPQQYPLTINALQSACNQTSNREPVVTYDETTVLAALDALKEQHLVRFVLPSHGRSVVRYRQVLDETLALDDRQCAVLAVLLLRGPQTVGEVRIRTERMARFESLEELEHEFELLGSRDEPLVINIGRRPGQKEERWATPLVAAPDPDEVSPRAAASGPTATSPNEVIDGLRSEIAEVRAEVADLRQEVQELRESLGG